MDVDYDNNGVDNRQGRNAAKFVELANRRVTRAIRDMRLIGNLANRTNYSYTDVQANKIIKALQVEIAALRSRFSNGDKGRTDEFRL